MSTHLPSVQRLPPATSLYNYASCNHTILYFTRRLHTVLAVLRAVTFATVAGRTGCAGAPVTSVLLRQQLGSSGTAALGTPGEGRGAPVDAHVTLTRQEAVCHLMASLTQIISSGHGGRRVSGATEIVAERTLRYSGPL